MGGGEDGVDVGEGVGGEVAEVAEAEEDAGMVLVGELSALEGLGVAAVSDEGVGFLLAEELLEEGGEGVAVIFFELGEGGWSDVEEGVVDVAVGEAVDFLPWKREVVGEMWSWLK